MSLNTQQRLIHLTSTVRIPDAHHLTARFYSVISFISFSFSSWIMFGCLYAYYVFHVLHLSRFQRKSGLAIHRNHCKNHHLSICRSTLTRVLKSPRWRWTTQTGLFNGFSLLFLDFETLIRTVLSTQYFRAFFFSPHFHLAKQDWTWRIIK